VTTSVDPSAAYPSAGKAWWAVALLCVAAIISYSDRQVMSLVVDPIRHDLGISDVQIGLLLGTAFAAIYGVAGIPLGYLADRMSRRNLIAVGMIGIGSAVVIGGALLHGIDAGLVAGTRLGQLPPWRAVLVLIGMPGLVLFAVVAMAAFVDNAIAAWSPALLIRNFHLDPGHIGVTLGLVFMIGGAVGMMTGGLLSDRAQRRFGWSGRVYVCLAASLLVMPTLLPLISTDVTMISTSILAVFFASAWITSSGLAAILDWVPNRRRGLATSISFFFNVAVGLGVGPAAVALTARYFADPAKSLAPSMLLVTAAGYVIAASGAVAALYLVRRQSNVAARGVA